MSGTAPARRFAILFSGLPYLRHVNELELCYRTLTSSICGFDPDNIFVLMLDGAWQTVRGRIPSLWSDGTPYRLEAQPRWPATLREIRTLLTPAALPLAPNDLLFIHMAGHGDRDTGGAFIQAYRGVYRASQMAADLKSLPAYRALLVLMSQCSAGGFADAVVGCSPHSAAMSSLAAAAGDGQESHFSPEVPHWNYFPAAWLSAFSGVDVISGAAINLVPPPPLVDADAAFAYAMAVDPTAMPVKASAGGGGQITLGVHASSP